MPLIAGRFFSTDDGEVVDLATAETVRLTLDSRVAGTQARAECCDRLAAVRHPLLLPLVDYGVDSGQWFEAHARLDALRVPIDQGRSAALHLVRFLRSAGVDLDAASSSRNVRAAVESSSIAWRPVGVVLQPRHAVETVRAAIESPGPPGVTAITISGPPGSGLRVARLCIARAARLAGFAAIDSRLGALDEVSTPRRHVCVLDWLTAATTAPVALTLAAADGARRHLWIRFRRGPAAGAAIVALENLAMSDLTAAIYADPELGPSPADIRASAAAANGRPGAMVAALTAVRVRPGATWVHETAPDYVVATPGPRAARGASAGVGRLERAVSAASILARRGRHARALRVLTRCAPALFARGAAAEAAAAACTLGELHLQRGQPRRALAAFDQARRWQAEPELATRALLGTARAMMEEGRLLDAEAAFRSATLAAGSGEGNLEARSGLAQVLCLRGRLDAAEEALLPGQDAMASIVLRLRCDLAGAARAAARAVRDVPDDDAVARCEAHLASLHVHMLLGSVDDVRLHARLALAAAQRSRVPALRLRAAAEAAGCFEQSGMTVSPAARRRLLSAARRLPPLAAARVRSALNPGGGDPDLRRFIDASGAIALGPTPHATRDLIQRFQALVDAVHDSPDDSVALQVIAGDLLAAVDASSVVVRSSRLSRPAATAGRPWAGEEALTRAVLDGGRAVVQDGLMTEAAEPVRAAGSTLGAIAVRWPPGAKPPAARGQDMLRVAAAVAAPILRGLRAAQTGSDESAQRYPDDLLGRGAAAERVRDAIRRAALAPYPVLIEGESGSGKELVARSIHARGPRRSRRFCAVNCAALSDDLLEAELFGHAKGAFTGALAERAGLFEEADQGTIFLDEAGELTPRAQAKLLRALQEGEVRRIGENIPRKVDARVVAATNRPIEEDVRAGRFRADLRFRIDVIRIPVPPLRERADEVPWLVERIWAEAAARVGTRATIGEDVITALARYEWPGNVRELQNVVASLAVHGPRRGRVPASLLPARIAAAGVRANVGIDEARLEFERRFVRAALAVAGGRKSVAAAQLGVSRQGLAKILKRLGIES